MRLTYGKFIRNLTRNFRILKLLNRHTNKQMERGFHTFSLLYGVYSSLQQFTAVYSSLQQFTAVYSSLQQFTAVYSSHSRCNLKLFSKHILLFFF